MELAASNTVNPEEKLLKFNHLRILTVDDNPTNNFILKEILDFNNVKFNIVYRMNLNLTFHTEIKTSKAHTDLGLPHKVVIVYLNTVENGRTIVLDETNQKNYSESLFRLDYLNQYF